jgi:hypothetical protein
VSSRIPNFDPHDARSALEKSGDWVRTLQQEQKEPPQYTPKRTWTYYLAIIIAVVILICTITGTGSVVLVKGQGVIQNYIERLYGIDEPSFPSK